MAVIGDLRHKGFRGKKMIWAELVNNGFLPMNHIILHSERPDTENEVIRIRKGTVKKLRRMNPYKRGFLIVRGFINYRKTY